MASMRKPPSPAETRERPLTSDFDVLHRVEQLLVRANMRQLWLMFLDADNLQLPVLMPIDHLPVLPDEQSAQGFSESLRMLVDHLEASALIIVIERYASATLNVQDAAWAASLRKACDRAEIPLRALVLLYRGGARMLTAHELASQAVRQSAGGA